MRIIEVGVGYYPIERGATPPKRKRYPLIEMKRGDRFTIPANEVTKATANNVRSSASYWKVRVSVRKNADGSLHVWRVG